jgi:hypothetical protein
MSETMNHSANHAALKAVAKAMDLTPDGSHLDLQLRTMLTAHGVDVKAFVRWMEAHHSNEILKAALAHTIERDMVRAWGSHIAAFKARGVKH